MARDARQLLRRKAPPPGRVLDVAVRVAAGVAAGYFLAHAFSALAAAALPFARPDRVVAGGMLALAVWAVAALYAFAARSAWRAAGVPLALALAMLGLAGLLGEQALRP